MLAVLPAGLQVLELAVPCAGPVLEVLTRFRHLQELRITGNGSDVTWETPGTAGVLSKLSQLHLDNRTRAVCMEYRDGDTQGGEVYALHEDIAGMLAPAARLHSLALRVRWDDDAAALCSALPALVNLR